MTQDNSISDAKDQAGATVRGAGGGEPLPLTEAQSDVWLAAQLSPQASSAFNRSCSIWLKGPFDEASMRRSLAGLTRRHAALRTRFQASGEGQTFADESGLRIETRNLSGLPEGERAVVLRGIQEAEGERVFDLAAGPLLAAHIVRMEAMVHVVVLTVHLIACDRWSYDILLGELGVLYSAARRSVEAVLPPAIPYAAYVRWEADHRASVAGRASDAYWRARFQTLPPILDLPSDRPYPSRRSYEGARVTRPLSAELCSALRRSVARREVTLFSQLLSAAATLLRHLSGERDLVIGVPAAGQNAMGVEALVGHCTSLLPLRLVLEDAMDSGRFAQQVQGWVLDAVVHQAITFGALIRHLPVVREPGRVPLVPVLFNLDRPPGPLGFECLTHQIEINPRRRYQFDLGFNVVEDDVGLTVECDFNTDILEASTVERWLGHYETVLHQMVADPATTIGALMLMSPEECRQWTADESDTERPFSSRATVPEILMPALAARLGETAVEAGDRSLTYAELDSRSSRLASHLRSLGVRPGVLVGVCCERTVDLSVVLLGVMKAGGAYVPLDPDFSRERLELMMDDAAVSVLVVHESLLGRIPRTNALVVCLDRDAAELDALPPVPPKPLASPRDLAYVLYTYGSTGKLMGVEVQHRALVNLLESMRSEPGLTTSDVWLAVTPLSCDMAQLEILLPLLAGGRCVMASREDAMDPVRLSRLMEQCGATVMQATPSTWRRLLDSGWSGRPSLKGLCGGEEMTPELAARLAAACGEGWNLYGLAETTIWSSLIRVGAGDPILIGRPIANTHFHVVDDKGRLVPPGLPGELWIGGVGLARGYRNQPDATSEKFIRDPFCGGESRLCRTGDRVRRHADGRMEFLGRADDPVKARRGRSELGDIEAPLAAVVCSAPLHELGFEPPQTETERALAALWEDVLQVEVVGRSDAFFERGGHSLLAVALCARIEKEFGRRLPLATVLGAPTLAGLASVLEPAPSSRHDGSLLVPIQRKGGDVPFFCVHGADGSVQVYRDLACRLGESQPFFGIQCEGIDGRSAALTTVEQMAGHYLEGLSAFYPRGPIRLGGYGMGGLVAYEMACRLRKRGRDVTLLALLDSCHESSPALSNSRGSGMCGATHRTGFFLSTLLQSVTADRQRSLREKLRRVREAVSARFFAGGRHLASMVGGGSGERGRKGGVTLADINARAGARYHPQPYPGRITLFHPQRNNVRFSDPGHGWAGLAQGGVEVVELPVNPQTMLLEPHVELLAEKLKLALAASV